jgi:hypothetical protein
LTISNKLSLVDKDTCNSRSLSEAPSKGTTPEPGAIQSPNPTALINEKKAGKAKAKIPEYEVSRLANIARNKKLLADLGLNGSTKSLLAKADKKNKKSNRYGY